MPQILRLLNYISAKLRFAIQQSVIILFHRSNTSVSTKIICESVAIIFYSAASLQPIQLNKQSIAWEK